MKKATKILTGALLAIMLVAVIATPAFALASPGDITAPASVVGGDKVTSIGKQVVGIIQTVGVVISVIVLIVLGIKYMIGSAEEKAEYKKTMIPYVIGAVLIFAASALAQVIYNVATGIKL